MLRDIEKLHREAKRFGGPRSATVTLAPGGPPVVVSVGDTVEFVYCGETRRVRILATAEWGLRCWDEVKSSIRGFSYDKIGAAVTPPETNAAASV